MNENNYSHHGNEGPDPGSVHHAVPHYQLPYWKRAHHDWRFWIGLFFMSAAITIFVLSDNLAFLPHG
jgi:NADH:ubiquinone oxidoreductase subunit 5 (subunit L)/multisubunit Na+/H+ antiporter MnhA subunit